jgi:hypothetical protein
MGLVEFPVVTVDMTEVVQRQPFAVAVSYFAAYDQGLPEAVESLIKLA